MCQPDTGPVITGWPAAPTAAQAGTGAEAPGTRSVLVPAGGVQRNAHTPSPCATSAACSGPASSPISAMLVAGLAVWIPSVGVTTIQVSGRTGSVPDPFSAYTPTRSENAPISPCDAITSAVPGMLARTPSRMAAAGADTRSHWAEVRGAHTSAQPSA